MSARKWLCGTGVALSCFFASTALADTVDLGATAVDGTFNKNTGELKLQSEGGSNFSISEGSSFSSGYTGTFNLDAQLVFDSTLSQWDLTSLNSALVFGSSGAATNLSVSTSSPMSGTLTIDPMFDFTFSDFSLNGNPLPGGLEVFGPFDASAPSGGIVTITGGNVDALYSTAAPLPTSWLGAGALLALLGAGRFYRHPMFCAR
ncbi:MAG TPA: hypothetical protein VFC78_01985 [Tepidisphaeraceae bacterium]|nr:hypothetical protein [Tepidisphaeraceae bacterium]